jgi:hypothetical protein
MEFNQVLRPGFRALIFLGGSTVEEINQSIIDYLLFNSSQQNVLFAEAEFAKPIVSRFSIGSRGVIAPQLKSGLRDTPELRLAYRLAMHDHVDCFIFQSAPRSPAKPLSRDLLEHSWEIGKNVTCGILADDVEQMAERVAELLETWSKSNMTSSINCIVGAFNRTPVSDMLKRRLSMTLAFVC